MVNIYSIYAYGSLFWLSVKAFATTLVPDKLIAHLGGPGHRASSVEVYFARFFGITLMPILVHIYLSAQTGNEDVRKANLYTTLFLHVTSAIHVFNRFTKTRDAGLTRDVGGSLLLTGLGVYILLNDLV